MAATINGIGRAVDTPPTEGERWAEEVLEELRRARWKPVAWIRFFEASLARAGRNRTERVRAHREVLMLGVLGLILWASVAALGRPLLGAVGGAWWLLVLLMVDWHLGMLERQDGSRLPGLGVANTLTLLRASAIPLLPFLAPTALGFAVLAAGGLDVADGLVARARGEASRLGAWLDAAVDGILLSFVAVAAAERALLPNWVAALIVARQLAPWLTIAGVYFATARAPRRYRYVSGRAPGVVLVAGLALAAFGVPGGAFIAAAGALGGLATFGATIDSGISRSRRARGPAERAARRP
jgi:phosphatidylglycerophosphate synthase